jgi:hypothetical protein
MAQFPFPSHVTQSPQSTVSGFILHAPAPLQYPNLQMSAAQSSLISSPSSSFMHVKTPPQYWHGGQSVFCDESKMLHVPLSSHLAQTPQSTPTAFTLHVPLPLQ